MKRVQMDMAPLTLGRLQRMQRRTEAASYGETIRNALLLYEQMLDATKDGGTIVVRDGASETRILFAFEDVERVASNHGGDRAEGTQS